MIQMVKNLPAMQETWIQSLGREDSLEKEMATHPSMSGEFHGQRSLAGYSPWDRIELVSFNSLNTVFHKEEFLSFNEV